MAGRARGRRRGRPALLAPVLLALLLPAIAGALAPPLDAPVSETGTLVVSFRHALTSEEWARFREAAGTTGTPLTVVAGSVIPLTEEARARASALPFVARIDEAHPIERHLDHAKLLSRAGREALDLGVTGRGVTVAIVDSGIDARHPDLDGRVVANVRLRNGQFEESLGDLDGHGTHVAGIVAGSGAASARRYAGVAPGARLVGIDISQPFDTASALLAFDWLLVNKDAYGIRVVVNSWGRAERMPYDPEDPLVEAANRLARSGLVLVFSASNHGPGPSTLSVEAQNPNVVTVGATNDAGVIAPYSARGPVKLAEGEAAWVKPDVVAAGTDIVSLKSGTATPGSRAFGPGAIDGNPRYYTLTGTSQAAPLVAGVIALLLEANPELDTPRILDILHESAIDLGPRGPDPAYGFGLLDAVDALQLARGERPGLGNPLIAGGEERYADQGRYTPTPETGLGLPGLTPSDVFTRIATSFPVKPGATQVEAEFRHTPASANLRIVLAEGEAVRARFTEVRREGDAVVHRATLTPDRAAVLRVLADGTNLGPVEWSASARILLPPQPAHANVLDPAHRRVTDAGVPLSTVANRIDYLLALAQLEYRLARADPEAYVEERPLVFATALATTALAGVLLGAGAVAGYRRLRQA